MADNKVYKIYNIHYRLGKNMLSAVHRKYLLSPLTNINIIKKKKSIYNIGWIYGETSTDISTNNENSKTIRFYFHKRNITVCYSIYIDVSETKCFPAK